jgi:hypothetical protein
MMDDATRESERLCQDEIRRKILDTFRVLAHAYDVAFMPLDSELSESAREHRQSMLMAYTDFINRLEQLSSWGHQ